MAANGILEFQGTEKAIFRGSNSNIVIDTANSSFGVGVDTPTSNLHIVGKTSLQGDLNLVQVSNVANVTVNSNVVTEYTGPHDRPLRKYPEVALTQNDESATSGYVVEQTNTASHGNADAYAYRLFDHSLSTAYQSEAVYSGGNPTGSTQTTTATDGSTHQGVAITLDLVTKIRLSYAKITSHTYYGRTPVEGTFLGSNNNSTWDVIGTFSGLSTTAAGQTHTVHIADYATKSAYRYIRLIVTGVHPTQDSGTILEFRELEYYGYEEGSGSLDTTLKSVYNVPATTGTQLEVYYDAKDLTEMPSTVTDLSPNSNGGSVTGATLDTTDDIESFKFDASSSQNITSTIDTSYWGTNKLHSVAFWFKADRIDGKYNIFQIGNLAASEASGFWISDGSADANSGNSLNWWFYGGDSTTKVSTFSWTLNTWYHIALTFDGSTKKMYVNGHHIDFSVGNVITTPPTGIPNPASLAVGSTNAPGDYFDGSIANFRIYGAKVLNADQVKELYDYQKDYFLGSKSQVTLYKGHLGVGVTEPSGQLELAGDERLQEYPPKGMFLTNTNNFNSSDPPSIDSYIEGHGIFRATSSIGNLYESQGPHGAFNDEYAWVTYPSHIYWGGPNAGYDVNTYLYTGNIQLSSKDGTPKGQWIKLQLPYHIKVNHYFTQTPNSGGMSGYYGVKSGQLWGSNDDVNWSFIHGFSDLNATTSGHYHDISTNNESYKYLALIITKNFGQNPSYVSGGSGDRVGIQRIRYFGTPGPTTLDKGSLSLTRSLDVPRISRYDVDTETPRPEKLVVDFDTTVNSSPTDISGRGNHGAFYNGASYSPADKAFSFDGGTNPETMAAGPISITSGSGVFIHTISFWGWVNEWSQVFFYLDDTYPPGGSDDDTPHCVLDANGNLRYDFWSNPVQVSNNPFPKNQWVHVGLVYKGGNVTSTSVEIYFNGVRQTVNTHSGNPYTSPSSVYLQVATSSSVTANMKISNFKLYSVALEPSEVRKLYNLGRTGRSMVISDTAVGIGKVPEAQLDIRGNLKLDGLVMPHIIAGSWVMTGGNPSATTIYMNEGNCVQSISNQNAAGQGNGISGNRGRFTAPVTGLYNISFNFVSGTRNSSNYLGTYTASGGAILTSPLASYIEMFDMRGADNLQESYAYTMCSKMDAGDTITFSTYSSSYVDGNANIVGSVHLIYAIPRATW